ncbi:MAG: DNRLRE domain-containing protein, partial [Thermoplasmata archaeon]
MPSKPTSNGRRSYRGRARDCVASGALALILVSSVLTFVTPTSSDPDIVDNGDFTKSVIWDFTDPGDYCLVNTTLSGGAASLRLLNETLIEDSTAQYLMGTASNLDLARIPDAMSIDDTSLPVHTLVLQPGPEAKDCYIDEWFPEFNPDGPELELSSEYDPNPFSSERCRIVMELNLSALPPGARIVNATLLLYEKQAKVPPLHYTIHALTHNWTETGVTWRTYDLASSGYWRTVGGDFSAEFFAEGVIDNTLGWKSFDLTRLVDLWVRGKIPNYGFIIVPSIETIDNAKTFSSSDITNKPEQRPRIVLNYTLGVAVGSYESAVIGPGTNSTFTLARWQTGLLSKASDEFDSGGLSSRWAWMNDPTAQGGSVNFDTPGWLNVTGSPSTVIADPPGGCNFLYQTVEGDFAAETGLRAHLAADGMGAGLLIRADRISWLTVYLTRSNGSGCVVAEVCNGNLSARLATVPWPYAAALLRMERMDGTYSMSASADGVDWIPLAAYSPAYDFPSIVAAGLCVFSGGSPISPVSEFDYFRMTPMGQAPALEMRVRTGNSTELTDPSWGPWGAPIGPEEGALINSTGMYAQYQMRLSTAWSWLSPLFLGFECHAEHYLSEGTVTTRNIYQLD